METAITIVAAYALGSISFAIVVSKLMRLPDPRSYGSKNPGATNVLRTGRKSAAVLTLFGDAAEGWLAVWPPPPEVAPAPPHAPPPGVPRPPLSLDLPLPRGHRGAAAPPG